MKPICVCDLYNRTMQARVAVPFCSHTHHVRRENPEPGVEKLVPLAVRNDWKAWVASHIKTRLAMGEYASEDERVYLADILGALTQKQRKYMEYYDLHEDQSDDLYRLQVEAALREAYMKAGGL